ncbi:hypothetical protein BJY04DRAFT_189134 [Aspergillus karnatakaensis]|uniref:uncharacterized protein n=1 Tax=Aspergillus karnatakaensis TaxID=1810916 RepID=UPI003CCD6DBD
MNKVAASSLKHHGGCLHTIGIIQCHVTSIPSEAANMSGGKILAPLYCGDIGTRTDRHTRQSPGVDEFVVYRKMRGHVLFSSRKLMFTPVGTFGMLKASTWCDICFVNRFNASIRERESAIRLAEVENVGGITQGSRELFIQFAFLS